MYANRFRAVVLAFAAGLGVSACTYGNGYGYSGLSLGYNSGGYYDDGFYGGGLGYDGYGYGGTFGAPYWGWYGDYYYPGAGYYVYDRNRRPFRWNDRQRTYWQNRYSSWRGARPGDRPNWDGFERRPGFDPRPGYQHVPRGSSQYRDDGRRGGRPDFDRNRGGREYRQFRSESRPNGQFRTPRTTVDRPADGQRSPRGERSPRGR